MICALADGQGGDQVEAAANLACQAAIEIACTYSPKQLTKPKTWIKILHDDTTMILVEPAILVRTGPNSVSV